MVWLDLRDANLGRVKDRERRSSVEDPWSDEVVVEGCVESVLVGVLVGVFCCSGVAVEGEATTGLGSVAVGTEVEASVEAMIDYSGFMMIRRFRGMVWLEGRGQLGKMRREKEALELKMMKELPKAGGEASADASSG